MRFAISAERTLFPDRRAAGVLLADAVAPHVRGEVVVGAIPRGGVVVAEPVARRLHAPLVPVHARKLPWPTHPELAFGAIDDDGEMILDDDAAEGLAPEQIDAARREVWDAVRRRRQRYGGPSPAAWIPGRTVVLVDDGLATGLTMRAAMAHARRHGARSIVVAVPCASESAARWFRRHADHFEALIVDQAFVAVGAYYDEFRPVEDEEVVQILNAACTHAGTPVTPGIVAR